MAEIDGTNPLTPVWPQRPYRKIEEDGKNNKRQKEEQEEPHDKKKDDDDNGIHIDEYV